MPVLVCTGAHVPLQSTRKNAAGCALHCCHPGSPAMTLAALLCACSTCAAKASTYTRALCWPLPTARRSTRGSSVSRLCLSCSEATLSPTLRLFSSRIRSSSSCFRLASSCSDQTQVRYMSTHYPALEAGLAEPLSKTADASAACEQPTCSFRFFCNNTILSSSICCVTAASSLARSSLRRACVQHSTT